MIKELLSKLKKNSFFASVAKVGSGQLIAQILSLISVPILSRIYSEADYGDVALITSTASILINLSTFGLNSAVMKPKDNEESKVVFTTAMLSNVIICTLFTAVCAVLFHLFQLFNVTSHYLLALVMMWLYSVSTTLHSLLIVYINKKGENNKLFLNPFIGAVANFVIAVPLGLFGFGYLGFLIASILQNVICCIHMMHKDIPIKKEISLKQILNVFKEYKDYVLYQFPSNLVGNFAIEYPTQYLGRMFTTGELGGYSMCVRVMKYPIRLIAAPISTVYFRTATEYHREGKNLAEFTYKMISKILLISALPVAVFIFVSEPLFVFVLGEKWAAAGQLAGFLIVQYILLFCSQTTSYCLVSIGKQKTNLIVTIIRLVVAVISCSLGYFISKNVTGTVLGYSIGQCIYNIFELTVKFACMDKRFMRRFLMASTLYTIVMFALTGIKNSIL